MKDREYEKWLEEFLDGTLPATPAPGDLTASVLRRTSGSPCEQAHPLLCDAIDGELEAVDSELLKLHMESCGGCRDLAAALARLPRDLASLAEIAPGPQFTREVMAETAYAPPPPPGLWERFAEGWRKAVLRPRFAMEAAYVGTALLMLLFILPFSPFRDVPSMALQAMREPPRIAVAEQVQPVREIGEKALEKAGDKVKGTIRGIGSNLDEKTRGIRRTGAEVGERVLDGDFKGAWSRLRERPEPENGNESPPEGGD